MGKDSGNLLTIVGRYEIGRVLGEGSFATVRLGRNVETGQDVAIKILYKEKVFREQLVERVRLSVCIDACMHASVFV
jgi:5'-AMP-activated protein kinase catalytic alpha subunit